MRRLVVIRAVVVAVILAVLAGCGWNAPGPATPGTTGPAPSPSIVLITVPDVVGLNAAVALDTLKKLGFTNIDLGTVDGREFVVLPQNWTVKSQTAQPGQQLAADAKIVLGCARNG